MQEISIDKVPTSSDNVQTIKTIAMWTTAMMNTSGGLIVLYCSNPDSDKKWDHWIMGLESVLTNTWISQSTFQSLVRFQYLALEGQLRIYMFVCKHCHMLTFTYNAYARSATGITPIKDASRIQEMLQESYSGHDEDSCASALKHLTKDHPLQFNDPIPITHRENQTIEFKHCYCGTSKKTELPSFDAEKLKGKLMNYFDYFSAFANTHGGSLVIGVEEGGKTPVIRGFQVVENQQEKEQKIINYLCEELRKCIWHADPDYQPCMGNDWDIFFHDVIQDGRPMRKIIEIHIPKHGRGMFLHSPTYYKVSDNGEDLVSNISHGEEKNVKQKKSFEDWKMRFYTKRFDSQKRDTDYFKQHLESREEGTLHSASGISDKATGSSDGSEDIPASKRF